MENILKLCEEDADADFFRNIETCGDGSSSSESSTYDDDKLLENMMPLWEKNKRISITNYVEDVVSKYSEKEFIKHFRISKETFTFVVTKYEDSEEYKMLTKNKRAMDAKCNLILFLWFVGHEGCSFNDLSDRFNVSLSSVHRIIKRLTYFISNMSPDYIKWATETEKQETSTHYLNKYGFPGVIGSVDGTHIRIDPPSISKDDYISRKGVITLHLQVICNEKKNFIDIFTGYPGSVHDRRVFRNSTIFNKLSALCKDNYILGDSAYPCMKFILAPYRDTGHLTMQQKNFNYRLSQCRVDVENAIGILKQRFRVLFYCKLKGIKYICNLVRACCVLHNLSRVEDIEVFDTNVNKDDDELGDNDNDGSMDTPIGKALRDEVSLKLPQKRKHTKK